MWSRYGSGVDQLHRERIKMETPIKAIHENGHIARPVLSKVDRMINAAKASFEITQDGI